MANDNEIVARLKVEGVNKFKADLTTATGAVEGMDNEITSLNSTLDVAKTKLSGMKEGTKEFKALQNEIKATEVAMKSVGDSMENAKSKLRNMQKEIVNMTFALKAMEDAGLKGTQQYKQLDAEIKRLTNDAGKLKDTIGDVSNTIKNAASDTRGIDNAFRAVNSLASGFQFAQAASVLLGKNTENLQKALLNLNAVMSATQAIREIQNELLKNDSVFTLAATKAKAAFNLVVGQGTNAMKLFRLALASTGIGLLVIGLGLLIAKFDEVKKFLVSVFPQLGTFGEKFTEIKNKITVFLKDGVLNLLNGFIRIYNQSEFVRGAISAIGATIVSLKDLVVANFRIIGTAFGSIFEAVRTLSFDPIKKGFSEIVQLSKGLGKKLVDNIKGISTSGQLSLLTANDIISDTEAKKTGQKTAKAIKTEVEKEPIVLNLIEPTITDAVVSLREQLKVAKEEIEALFYKEYFSGTTEEGQRNIAALRLQIQVLEEQLKAAESAFNDLLNPQRATANISQAVGGTRQKPLTLFERIFGTEDDNRSQLERMSEGAKKIVDELIGFGQQIGNIASQAIGIRATKELNLIEEQRERGLISEREYEKRSAEIKTEAARKERAAQIAIATAQIPQAVLAAFISGSKISPIVGGILAGLAGAFATAQVALLAAAPLPKFKQGGSVAKRTGLIKGKKHEQGGVLIEAEGDEYVIKGDAVRKYGVQFFDKLNDMKINPIITSGEKIKMKDDKSYRFNENLATMASYLKQVYKTDAQGNIILTQIRDNIAKNNKVYV